MNTGGTRDTCKTGDNCSPGKQEIKYILDYYDEELFVHDHRCVYSLLNRKIDWKYDVFLKGM